MKKLGCLLLLVLVFVAGALVALSLVGYDIGNLENLIKEKFLTSELNILKDAEWSLKPGVPTWVTWVNKNGQTVQTQAISGEVQIIVEPAKTSLNSVTAIVSKNGATVFAQLPAVGIYWVRVPQGTEAAFIKATREFVKDAFPNMVLKPKQTPTSGSLTLPTNYSGAQGRKPIRVTSGNLVIDDLSEPMNLGDDNSPIYIMKNPDGTIATDSSGHFRETQSASQAAAHGDIVNYYRTDGYQIAAELGSGSILNINNPNQVPNSDEILGIASIAEASKDIKQRPVINLSWGPTEYSGDVKLRNDPDPEVRNLYNVGWESYNRSNNGSYLDSFAAVLGSNVPGTRDATIVWAAGNSGTDMTSTLVNQLSTNPIQAKQIITVGALDAGGQIAGYSNYSTAPGTMIYVPVTGTTTSGIPVKGTIELTGRDVALKPGFGAGWDKQYPSVKAGFVNQKTSSSVSGTVSGNTVSLAVKFGNATPTLSLTRTNGGLSGGGQWYDAAVNVNYRWTFDLKRT